MALTIAERGTPYNPNLPLLDHPSATILVQGKIEEQDAEGMTIDKHPGPFILSSASMHDIVPFLKTDVVKIFVGPKRKEYHVHIGLLCKDSRYFKEYFDTPQSNKTAIYEPEVDAAAFETLLSWLYSGKLKAPYAPDNQSVRPFLKLYFLAIKFEFEVLSNLVMDGIRLFYRDADGLPLDDARFIYSRIKGNSPLRGFAVSAFTFDLLYDEEEAGVGIVYGNVMGKLLEKGGELVRDLYREMMDRAMRHLEEDDCHNPYLKSFPFTFHQHVNTPRCAECMTKEDFLAD